MDDRQTKRAAGAGSLRMSSWVCFSVVDDYDGYLYRYNTDTLFFVGIILIPFFSRYKS